MSNKTFPTIEAFYEDNPARRSSGEADYGSWWTEAGKAYPKWRVSYIKATGEVYAVQLFNPEKVELLGIIPPDDGDIYYKTLDGVLAGWADVCGQPGSLDWIRQRVQAQRTLDKMEDFWKHQASGAEPMKGGE